MQGELQQHNTCQSAIPLNNTTVKQRWHTIDICRWRAVSASPTQVTCHLQVAHSSNIPWSVVSYVTKNQYGGGSSMCQLNRSDILYCYKCHMSVEQQQYTNCEQWHTSHSSSILISASLSFSFSLGLPWQYTWSAAKTALPIYKVHMLCVEIVEENVTQLFWLFKNQVNLSNCCCLSKTQNGSLCINHCFGFEFCSSPL